MINLNSYIIEKLKIDKKSKVEKTDKIDTWDIDDIIVSSNIYNRSIHNTFWKIIKKSNNPDNVNLDGFDNIFTLRRLKEKITKDVDYWEKWKEPILDEYDKRKDGKYIEVETKNSKNHFEPYIYGDGKVREEWCSLWKGKEVCDKM